MKCKGTTSGGTHDFCIFEDGVIGEDEEIELSCNNQPCKEKRTFKITLLSLEEVKE